MRDLRRKSWRAAFAAVVLAGAWLATCARAQDRWRDRDAWQRPEEVMDALGARPGSAVADVGAGRGYFTFKLAARVGPQGKVYAVDIDEERVDEVRRRAENESLAQVKAIRGLPEDPKLPAGALDGVLVVNAYHEMKAYDAMLQGMFRALKPGGTLVIIDHAAEAGKPRETYQRHHTIPESLVREDAARNGFQFARKERDIVNEDHQTWFFLVFTRPSSG